MENSTELLEDIKSTAKVSILCKSFAEVDILTPILPIKITF
jgi:hypothetical protein